jgi:lipoprotein-anchoring transpeptidase ErfK/SrfK
VRTPNSFRPTSRYGCIRLRNADILKPARLMKVGTPLTIR